MPDKPTPPHSLHETSTAFVDGKRWQSLKLISFNIQVGIRTHAFHHYFTRGWQHVLPHHKRNKTLEEIGRLLRDYDVVALQEADGGSIRSGFVNQVKFLAEEGQFPCFYQQLNRNLGKLAQHSNGLLSRIRPHHIEDHTLPGFLPGRGVILMQLGTGEHSLLIAVLHLSLGTRAQDKQLKYVCKLVEDHPHVVIMGDLNNPLEHLYAHTPLKNLGLISAASAHHTYPSWQPMRAFDHILVSPSLEIRHAEVLDCAISDHRPVAMEIGLPDCLQDF
ncbi:MAG: endonuclease/exonuclease/phosphatase family protein [Pontibacterium sp.]